MGFYATDTLESCPAAKGDPLKKSRLGFFSTSGSRAGFSALQPVETHWENEATSTKTVSGSFRHYEYNPFGQTIVATGPMAEENPFRFSTKYFVDELDISDWGYRWYRPSFGRWLARDPIMEDGFILMQTERQWQRLLNAIRDRRGIEEVNLHSFAANDPIDQVDYLGALLFCYCNVAIPTMLPGPCFPSATKGGIKYTGTCAGRWNWSKCLCGQECYALTAYKCKANGKDTRWYLTDDWNSSCP